MTLLELASQCVKFVLSNNATSIGVVWQYEGSNTCFIFDRHKGLISAMNKVVQQGNDVHMFCLRHVCSNFNNVAKSTELKENLEWFANICRRGKFWEMFRKLHSRLADLNDQQKALKWLDQLLPKEKWALGFDEQGKRFGTMTSNAAECFNSVLLGCRDLPVTAIVQFTFSRLNKYFTRNRSKANAVPPSKTFVPYIEDLILAKKSHAATHCVKLFNKQKGIYQVTTRVHHYVKKGKWKLGRGGNNLLVNFSNNSCSCGKWSAFHYPCSHVMAVCMKNKESFAPYIDPYFTMDAYRKTWAPTFNPIPDVDDWPWMEFPTHVPNPIFMRTAKGRPRTRRFKNEMDKGFQRGPSSIPDSSQSVEQSQPDIPNKPTRSVRCSICLQTGHNKRGCVTNK